MFKIIVVALIYDKNRKVLLGKRSYTDKNYPGFWGLPGGTVEDNDCDLNVFEKTLSREIFEEIGCKIEIAKYIESHKNKNKIYVVFECKIVDGVPQPLHDTEEVKYFDIFELSDKLCPNVKRIIENTK